MLGLYGGKHSSIMLALIGTMPTVVTALLDRCIIKSDTKTDSEHYCVKPINTLSSNLLLLCFLLAVFVICSEFSVHKKSLH